MNATGLSALHSWVCLANQPAGEAKVPCDQKKLTNLIDHVIVIPNRIDGGLGMQTVTVSPKYQVVIPKAVREALHLRPGQKMQVIEYDGRIELVPERDIKELRGFLKGINTEFEREEDRV
jgi:AbrB family looped-hinge helix DNA binding protein